MKYIISITIICFAMTAQLTAQTQTMDSTKKYTKTPTGFLMVLRQGEDVFAQLEALATEENIPSASITGIGFINAKFGYFNQQTKQYDPKEFNDVELASLAGSVAWQDNKPSLHLHGVVTDKKFNAYGGHLLGAVVSTGSAEITVIVHTQKLERKMEEPPGANVLEVR